MPLEKLADFSVQKLSILDENGKVDESLMPPISPEKLRQFYNDMVFLRTFDEKALKLQRQGRIGTYTSPFGQEACTIGSAHAMEKQDWAVPAFREHGLYLVRGVSLSKVLQYWGGDERGSKFEKGVNVLPVSVPVGSQPLHASGIGMAMKFKKTNAACIGFVGDGGTSEGDFHEAMNFAGVFKANTVMIVQNNQFAISVPRSRQTASQTIAQKAIAYGFEGLQVDGNDVIAVYNATKEALDKARSGKGPALLELYTYRMGDHTTADDATRYRKEGELEAWRKKDPIARFEKYLMREGILSEDLVAQIKKKAVSDVEKAVTDYESFPPEKPNDMFDYLFETPTKDLEEQKKFLKDFLEKTAKRGLEE
jgi:pyruvate dehydrogenase E1 component alpha subunit